MPTAAERQALVFLVAVALVGGGVRLMEARRIAQSPVDGQATAESGESVETQLAAVDSERRHSVGRHARPTNRPPARPDSRLSAPRQPDAGVRPPTRKLSPDSLVAIDVDAASADELERLPRIGAALAQRIVANRDSLGPFGSIQALTRVRGIGPAMARQLKPMVTFSGGPSPFRGQLRTRSR